MLHMCLCIASEHYENCPDKEPTCNSDAIVCAMSGPHEDHDIMYMQAHSTRITRASHTSLCRVTKVLHQKKIILGI